MLELPTQIVKKHKKALEKAQNLNISNKKFTELKEKWDDYVAVLSTPVTTNGIKDMLANAENQTELANKTNYIQLCAQYL
ncbi:uncharacterized protein ATC70_007093 [Mucor velutinosus]|uniref:Uncharacterized protein n=1 Tax=Mucor velutinosus TaxID=708070 RepID=A0AAN7D8F9_9FUNG|nr:hypothetical protein ATC70_007093 [Mucor velutinosus]